MMFPQPKLYFLVLVSNMLTHKNNMVKMVNIIPPEHQHFSIVTVSICKHAVFSIQLSALLCLYSLTELLEWL